MLFLGKDYWGLIKYLPGFSLKNVDLFWRSGIGWGKRTDNLTVQLLPSNLITAEDGQFAVPFDEPDLFFLLGFLNCRYAQRTINFICGGHKGPGYVGSLPLPKEVIEVKEKIAESALSGYSAIRKISSCDELSLEFISPFIFLVDLDIDWIKSTLEYIGNLKNQAQTDLLDIDRYVLHAQNIKKENYIEQDHMHCRDIDVDWPKTEKDLAFALISYCLGVVLGRWDIRNANSKPHLRDITETFSPAKSFSAALLTSESRLTGAINIYPIEISPIVASSKCIKNSNILDRRIREIFQTFWPKQYEIIENDICNILKVSSLSTCFNDTKWFFSEHLKQYSRTRRQAPIYWPLQTATGSFTLWIYYHQVNEQILYSCVNDFVELELQSINEDLATLKNKTVRDIDEEKEFGRLTDLKVELENFRDELLRIAKFWKPNLNDGVQITAAPLWRLFQHKSWQKKLKATWEKLEQGEYDWAHLAYSIWPTRVLLKCHTDRSLAIAHEVEEDLWHEVEVIKPRKKEPVLEWQPKPLSDTELNTYIKNKIQTEGLGE